MGYIFATRKAFCYVLLKKMRDIWTYDAEDEKIRRLSPRNSSRTYIKISELYK